MFFKFILLLIFSTYFRALDLSRNPQDHQAVMYDEAESSMKFLISQLPLLKWLDISGTNLCGWVPEPFISHRLLDNKQRYSIILTHTLSLFTHVLVLHKIWIFRFIYLQVVNKLHHGSFVAITASGKVQMVTRCLW